jgi:DNA (cytosine-5)-methyltransferase 1
MIVALSYDKLWKLLIDKKMKKMQLRQVSGISTSTLAKLGKNEPVGLEIMERICIALDCNIGDAVDVIPSESSMN